MELNERLGRALQAAKQGDVDGVDIEISRLHDLPAEAVVGLRVKLRGIARSVRSHPSYQAAEQRQAG